MPLSINQTLIALEKLSNVTENHKFSWKHKWSGGLWVLPEVVGKRCCWSPWDAVWFDTRECFLAIDFHEAESHPWCNLRVIEVVGCGQSALLAEPAMVRDYYQVLVTNGKDTQDHLTPLWELSTIGQVQIMLVSTIGQIQIMYVILIPCFLPL